MGRRMDRRRLLAAIAAPLLLVAGAPAAVASIDASGSWVATITTTPPIGPLSCTLFLTQAGSALSASANCPIISSLQLTGTIDSSTGAFTLSGFEGSFCNNTVTFSGTVAPDGRTFTGVTECAVPVFPYPVDVAGTRCGNGVLDPGEACDSGNQVGNGACCSATCDSAAPEGTSCGFADDCGALQCNGSGTCQFVTFEGPCDDSNDCTTNDTCTGGECQGQPVADGTSCDDGDQCTTGDTCNSGFCFGQEVDCGPCQECDFYEGCIQQEPQPFCSLVPPGRSTLRVRDDPTDKKDVVSWKLAPDAGISIGDLGDPRSFTSYQVCVFDDVFESDPFFFGNLLAGVSVPAGGTCGNKPCWTPKRNGYRYTDKSGASDGVRSLDLEAGDGKSASLSIFAKGPSVGIAPLPAELPVVVQLTNSEGLCWQANFLQARLNGPLELRARIPSSPSGAFVE